MEKKSYEIIQSGKASFKIEVPYKLLESGPESTAKPLIVYLHGFNQTEREFRKDCKDLLKVHAYHLFIQAPYPVYDRKKDIPVSKWGRAWYLYDGNQDQFLRSMDHASRFIGQIIEKTVEATKSNRTAVLGYSMGGYLAGYHAIKWPQQVQDLIICSARYKSELLEGDYEKINHQSILALHGSADKRVESSPQRHEIEGLKQQGIEASFVALVDGHKFSQAFTEKILDWLNDKGYTCDPI